MMSAISHDPVEEKASELDGAPALKVLFILGWGRSGTTILDNILGELEGFLSVGELRYLWQRGLMGSARCGCEQLVRECSFWSSVLKVGFGKPEAVPAPTEVVSWQADVARVRHTWRLLRQDPQASRATGSLARYIEVSARLYRAIGEVTGARVVVDSSKRPSDAALLRLVPGVTPFFVHMVRDPRAVAHSWHRPKALTTRDPTQLMRTHGPVSSTLQWLGWNLAARSLTRRERERSRLVRYEDFVARPQEIVTAVASLLGERPQALPFLDHRVVRLGGNHTVSGNPSRFDGGVVEVRADDEWLTRQAPLHRALATLVALPSLRNYGYRLRP